MTLRATIHLPHSRESVLNTLNAIKAFKNLLMEVGDTEWALEEVSDLFQIPVEDLKRIVVPA